MLEVLTLKLQSVFVLGKIDETSTKAQNYYTAFNNIMSGRIMIWKSIPIPIIGIYFISLECDLEE